jgi:hypothetical protein
VIEDDVIMVDYPVYTSLLESGVVLLLVPLQW